MSKTLSECAERLEYEIRRLKDAIEIATGLNGDAETGALEAENRRLLKLARDQELKLAELKAENRSHALAGKIRALLARNVRLERRLRDMGDPAFRDVPDS